MRARGAGLYRQRASGLPFSIKETYLVIDKWIPRRSQSRRSERGLHDAVA